MASATAPPTPVSISSNTSVGAEPRSASTTLSASRKRASSPPEATFISGPGRVPGLVRTQNSTRSMPCGPPASASLSIAVEKRARSSFRGLSSRLTAASSFSAARLRAVDRVSAAPRWRASASFARASRRPEFGSAGVERRKVASPGARSALRVHRPAHCTCAPPRAARTAAPRCVRARADRVRRRRARPRLWRVPRRAP